MLQDAYYSVIRPEGCAGILWKSHQHAAKAADVLRFTSEHLPKLGVVDDVIEEPLGGAHRDHHQMASRLKSYLSKTIDQLSKLPVDELIENRYSKFRKMGSYLERLEDGTMQPFGYSFVT
jgi:acetyl-CoA carboxylase carboxyl transferase subunit alpha